MLDDTSRQADRVRVGLRRKATPEERLQRALSAGTATIRRSRQAIARARPDLSEQERNQVWVEAHCGREIAKRGRAHLTKRWVT